ncbi:MAG: Holliday junction branch migration protein RuvA [Halobacteriota archaeon]|nr:Holliday junction branch migration protein RuvA [Halobacteriota archaeon]
MKRGKKRMISLIRGTIELKTDESVVVDVNGIGLEIVVPSSTLSRLADIGEEVKLHTHLQLREDSLKLFGFSSLKEKELFELLINISGVGPKMAIAILSDIPAKKLERAITQEDLITLTSVSGIGRKTAQRLILELKEKIGLLSYDVDEDSGTMGSDALDDAVVALVSLGYSEKDAKKSVKTASESINGNYTLEELIKKTLATL